MKRKNTPRPYPHRHWRGSMYFCLSPFDVESVAFEAGRIMLRRIDFLLATRQDFVIETTLSSKSYARTIQVAKKAGYDV